jgi:hypothetical protein
MKRFTSANGMAVLLPRQRLQLGRGAKGQGAHHV